MSKVKKSSIWKFIGIVMGILLVMGILNGIGGEILKILIIIAIALFFLSL